MDFSPIIIKVERVEDLEAYFEEKNVVYAACAHHKSAIRYDTNQDALLCKGSAKSCQNMSLVQKVHVYDF